MYYLGAVSHYRFQSADELDLRRDRAIGSVVSGLNTLLAVYRSATYLCPDYTNQSFCCGSMLLGALTTQMDSARLFFPKHRAPYFGQSFDAVCDIAQTMKSDTWFHNRYVQHNCCLSTAVIPIVDSAIASVEELRLREK